MTTMIAANKMDYVKAIGRLYDFSSRIKFHLIKKEFIEDEIGKIALEINSDIANKSGINLFAARDDKDLFEYEVYLNSYNLDFTKNNFDYIELTNDTEFLKRTHPVSKDYIKNFSIINGVDELRFFKEHLQITVPSLNAYLNNPDFVEIFKLESEDVNHQVLLQSSRVKVKHKEGVFFAFYTNDGKKIGSYRSTKATGVSSKNFELNICFIFTNDRFTNYYNSPSELFLLIIELYGANFGPIGKRKKLFIDEYFYNDELRNSKQVNEFIEESSDFSRDHMNFTTIASYGGTLADKVVIGFSIDYTKYLRDYENGSA